jgi:hypothetical protein
VKTTREEKLDIVPTASPCLIDLVIIDMFETLIQQALNWEGGVVFIPLAFGLAVGLGYVLISAARHKRRK